MSSPSALGMNRETKSESDSGEARGGAEGEYHPRDGEGGQNGQERKREREEKHDGPAKRGVRVGECEDRTHKRQKDGAETAAAAAKRPPLRIPRNVSRADSSADTLLKNVIEQRFNERDVTASGSCSNFAPARLPLQRIPARTTMTRAWFTTLNLTRPSLG